MPLFVVVVNKSHHQSGDNLGFHAVGSTLDCWCLRESYNIWFQVVILVNNVRLLNVLRCVVSTLTTSWRQLWIVTSRLGFCLAEPNITDTMPAEQWVVWSTSVIESIPIVTSIPESFHAFLTRMARCRYGGHIFRWMRSDFNAWTVLCFSIGFLIFEWFSLCGVNFCNIVRRLWGDSTCITIFF